MAIPIIQNEIPSAFSQIESSDSSNSSDQSPDTSGIDFSMSPRGCFLHTLTNEIFFNPEDGAPNYDDRQLCKSNCEFLFHSW